MPLYRQDVYAGFALPAGTKTPSRRLAYRDLSGATVIDYLTLTQPGTTTLENRANTELFSLTDSRRWIAKCYIKSPSEACYCVI